MIIVITIYYAKHVKFTTVYTSQKIRELDREGNQTESRDNSGSINTQTAPHTLLQESKNACN